jgi:signal transduction histidine kinase
MKSMRGWLLRRFLFILLIFVAMQALLLVIGFRIAISLYNRQTINNLEDTAREILINPANPDIPALDYSAPFFVFRADRSLAYTNRGQGRSLEPELLKPVRLGENTIGYWYAAQIEFQDRRENRLFLLAVGIMAGTSLLVSGILASVAAGATAGRLSRYLAAIRSDVRSIDGKNRVGPGDFPISELSDISQTIGDISVRLAEEEAYKSQWMQDMAHDLRTPVAGIKSQLEAMIDGVLPADPGRLRRSLEEIGRMESMVSDINALSTLENRREMLVETIEASRLLEDLRQRFEQRFHQAEMKIDFSGDPALRFSADPQLIFRAASNLLENALAYSAPGSLVLFSIDKTTAIADGGAGPGMIGIRSVNAPADPPGEEIQRWFQRFHRGEFSRKTAGSGLGLNIAREIFRRHGGDLSGTVLADGRIEFTGTLSLLSRAAGGPDTVSGASGRSG